jgi:hypothetical protein
MEEGLSGFRMTGGTWDRGGIFSDKLKLAWQPPYDVNSAKSTQFGSLLNPYVRIAIPEDVAHKASGWRKLRFESDLVCDSEPPQHGREMYSARSP